MASIVTNSMRVRSEHFEPEPALDPADQRKLRGYLEQIDYTAYAANCAVIGEALGGTTLATFERLAVAAAQARARWVGAAAKMAESATTLTHDQATDLAMLRQAYVELSDAYEGMRRLVERGYLSYQPKG